MPKLLNTPPAFAALGGAISVPQMGSTTYGVGSIEFALAGVNFNSANTDNAIPITLPTGFLRYSVNSIRICNPSASLSSSTFGVFTATAAGGTVIVASGTANTITTAADGTGNNTMAATIAATANNTVSFTLAGFPTLYFRVQTAQGSAATATVIVLITPLP